MKSRKSFFADNNMVVFLIVVRFNLIALSSLLSSDLILSSIFFFAFIYVPQEETAPELFSKKL